MTLEQKRIAIAESQGWKRDSHDARLYNKDGKTYYSENPGRWLGTSYAPLPNYFTDPAAAVSLCEAMAKEGWDVTPSCFEHTRLDWICEVRKIGQSHSETAPTFSAAVAECYGKAKGLWT